MKTILKILIVVLTSLLLCATLIGFLSYKRHVNIRKNIRAEISISDFALYKNYLYFGAGYNLCRIDLPTKSPETLYTTNIIQVEKPVIADNIVYFGGAGSHFYNEQGAHGDKDSFFAFDLQKKEILWRYPLDPHSYGTFGTYPILSGNKVLVCARRHLYCLDRTNGKRLWQIDNWFGKDSDSIQIPYVYKNNIFHKLNSLKDDPCDGFWVEVSISDGRRTNIILLSKSTVGQGLGIEDDGTLYLTTRYVDGIPRNGYIGAIDLANKKLLWEIGGNFSRSRPSVNDKLVFTSRWDSVAALDKKNGSIVWEKNIEEITVNPHSAFEHNFRILTSSRIASTDKYVFVRNAKGIIALNALNGEKIWSVKHVPDFNPTYPIIVNESLIISNLNESSVVALNLETGKELWKVKIPNCSVYILPDDD